MTVVISKMNFPYKYHKQHREKSKKNMDVDLRFDLVLTLLSHSGHIFRGQGNHVCNRQSEICLSFPGICCICLISST